jgi:hypothetical protein
LIFAYGNCKIDNSREAATLMQKLMEAAANKTSSKIEPFERRSPNRLVPGRAHHPRFPAKRAACEASVNAR